MDKISKAAEIRSRKLKTSPVKANMPFRNKSPAQNRVNCKKGCIPNTSIRKAIADTKSIPPKIFTARDIEILSYINS
ncbi:MAG: hypothetical protein Q8Q31_03375 [Nanoarchaeota archaeon]|nr:hypothetical protein [Nanoarchaeota archaeon]